MNTSALKAFAPAVRRSLMEAVERKLDVVLAAQSPDYLTTYAPQVTALRALAAADRAQLIERVAYSWFNRLAALRYLDARGWHPFRARVLTASGNETQPELLREMRAGSLPTELVRHTEPARLNDLLDGRIPSIDPQGEVYRHLVLAACRFYHALVPDLFERLDDATELLLPDDLLTEHSVAQGFRTEISDVDCDDVEILGWLYQFYISERKDQVMARKSAVPTVDIPAVTQLFTPHWIVRYLVENSLGRLWLLNRPGSRLREQMPYYIEGEAETDFLRVTSPEEIRLCDPAVGSGHMLTYAFDLLYAIYEEEGYAAIDIPGLILHNNLVGLDIDARAAQLASLALVLKAREHNPRFFEAGQLTPPQIIELQDVSFGRNELRDYSQALELGTLFDESMLRLLHQFEDAKTFGSLIQPCLGEPAITDVRRAITAAAPGDMVYGVTYDKVLRVLDQAEALTQRYHVVVANPPYMGGKGMNVSVKRYLQDYFTDYGSDLFSGFIVRSLSLSVPNGYLGFMSPFVWMFISSYEKLRERLVVDATITTLVQLEYSGFDGATVPICTFALQNRYIKGYRGGYVRLSAFRGSENQSPKTLEAIANRDCGWFFRASADDFKRIPGSPIVYWLSNQTLASFSVGVPVGNVISLRAGMSTGDNTLFQRQWHEVSSGTFCRDALSSTEACSSAARWFPCHSGGEYRKWYGNHGIIVDWENDGLRIKGFGADSGRVRSAVRNEDYYYLEGITWSKISSGMFAARYRPTGFLFDDTGRCGFTNEPAETYKVLALFCSKLSDVFLKALCPTLSFTSGEIAKIPFIEPDRGEIIARTKLCISIARADWDNFETSWDFRDQPLLRPGLKGVTLEASWRNWAAQSTAAIHRMQELETENNRLFIAAYGLEGELEPEVPEEQITLARAEGRRDMAAFLSYAVGCMMGRYSLDHPGLILANAGDTLQAYLAKVGKSPEKLTFAPDEDGIIPVLEGEWFEDDIVARTRDFLRATFGDATLRENLRFIEESLGRDLRKYFLTDFYKDHLQTYKKRPIYWMVQSPKRGFAVLIYLHRYTHDTLNLVLNRYLREYQGKLRNHLAQLERTPADDLSARDRAAARKETERLTKVLHECEEWERQTLLPLAQQRIELDLDDGVKVNYLKLSEALAPIPGLAAADE